VGSVAQLIRRRDPVPCYPENQVHEKNDRDRNRKGTQGIGHEGVGIFCPFPLHAAIGSRKKPAARGLRRGKCSQLWPNSHRASLDAVLSASKGSEATFPWGTIPRGRASAMSRIIAAAVAAICFVFFALTQIANVVAIAHLPKDLRDAAVELALVSPTLAWGIFWIGLISAIYFMHDILKQYRAGTLWPWRSRSPRLPPAMPATVSPTIAEAIPDLRVADDPSVIALFEGQERDKLFPLLEAEKILAWARPMKGGAPGEELPPTKISGAAWKSHFFLFLPRVPGQFERAQTFVKTKARQETIYYDLYINRAQMKRAWPDRDFSEYISLEDAAREAYGRSRGTSVSEMAERASHPLIWYVYFFFVTSKTPIYGNMKFSSKRERVQLQGFAPMMEGDHIIMREQWGGKRIWENLCMKRTDLPAAFEKLEELGREVP
jgi:hypothetical protein